jgi:hypothetical protein
MRTCRHVGPHTVAAHTIRQTARGSGYPLTDTASSRRVDEATNSSRPATDGKASARRAGRTPNRAGLLLLAYALPAYSRTLYSTHSQGTEEAAAVCNDFLNSTAKTASLPNRGQAARDGDARAYISICSLSVSVSLPLSLAYARAQSIPGDIECCSSVLLRLPRAYATFSLSFLLRISHKDSELHFASRAIRIEYP